MALYTTPETKGLFHGAIAQSGTALSGYYHQEKHPLFYLKYNYAPGIFENVFTNLLPSSLLQGIGSESGL